jgi:RNA polymerase sigma factor (sigma-70 family)
MRIGKSGAVLRQLHRLFDRGGVAGLAEAQLLERFVRDRDEAAFEALVARYGPMVLGICRRALDDPDDVEDAFQATFLVLVKKANSIRDGDLLGNWLYGVAMRVAARARARGARRRAHEAPGAEEAAVAASGDGERRELRSVLDEEVGRLPEKYRAPIVLCYFQGQTHEEAARRLRWPVGTVRSRMARARDLLRERLTRRGLALPAGLLGSALAAEAASAAVPPALLTSTVKAAMRVAAGEAVTAGAVSAGAVALAEGVARTMSLNKLTVIGTAALALGVASGGAGVVARQVGGREPAPAPRSATPDVQLAQAGTGAGSSGSRPGEVEQLRERLATVQKQADDFRAKMDEEIGSLKRELETLRAARGGAPATGGAGTPAAGQTGGMMSGMMPGMMGRGGGGAMGGAMPGMGGMMSGMGGGGGMPGMMGMGGMGSGGMGGMASGGYGGGMGMGMGMPGGMMGGYGRGMGAGSGAMSGMGAGGFGGMAGGMGGGQGGGEPGGQASAISKLVTDSLVVVQPDDEAPDQILACSVETGRWKAYRAPKGTTVTPIASNEILATAPEGDKITQVAAFDPKTGEWYPQDLREPAKGQLMPQVNRDMVVYQVGRSIYAFSAQARKWDVLRLGKGARPVPVTHNTVVTVEQDNHLYVFSGKTGRWEGIEIQTKDDESGGGDAKDESVPAGAGRRTAGAGGPGGVE